MDVLHGAHTLARGDKWIAHLCFVLFFEANSANFLMVKVSIDLGKVQVLPAIVHWASETSAVHIGACIVQPQCVAYVIDVFGLLVR